MTFLNRIFGYNQATKGDSRMKNSIVSVLAMSLTILTASAVMAEEQKPVYVSGSIYMAMSPGSSSYFQNIQGTLKAAQSAGALISDINEMSFIGALVAGQKVTYSYVATANPTPGNDSCRVYVEFSAIQGQSITDLSAKLDCTSSRED